MIHVGGNHARARRARHQYIQSELERSVGEFVANEDGREMARKLMGEELRDSAIFVVDGRLFATEKFIASSKKRGHAIMLSSTIRNGGLTNTAYAHISGADGGATGPPCINGTGYEVPTTVIAKRSGYAQCGILVPNPYFGRGDLHGAWARQQVRYSREGRDRRVGRDRLRVRLSRATALALHPGQRRRGALLVLVELGVRELGRA